MTAAAQGIGARLRRASPLARRAQGAQEAAARRTHKALRVAQWERYRADVVLWARECVQIQVAEDDGAPWVAFEPWPMQAEVLGQMAHAPRLLILKARQLGLTWLALIRALHRLVFYPGSRVLILSLREDEAVAALRRLSGMYRRLPAWQRAAKCLRGWDSGGALTLSTGSEAVALPSHRGDSYTAQVVIVDEAALIPSLRTLLASVEPTVGDQGQIYLISRANKQDPLGTFATLCAKALSGASSWKLLFLPWHARPDRDPAWYEAKRQASLDVDGTLDTLHGQYPASAQEALAPSTGDRRVPPAWLVPCVELRERLEGSAPGVEVWSAPVPGRSYVIGVDPAEGLAHGDDSAVVVVDAVTGEEVVTCAGKWEPKGVLPELVRELSAAYASPHGTAPALVERNNHGHAVIGALQALGVPLVAGPDGAPGYAKSPASKANLWTNVVAEVYACAQARTPEALAYAQETGTPPPPALIHSPRTARQVGLLESSTCKAPQGEHDDIADAWGLAQFARTCYRSAWMDRLLDAARR